MLKTEKNYRIIFNEMVSYLRDLGLVVNTNTKARGHQGFFLKNRIDISTDLDEKRKIEVLIHEFTHFVHYQLDSNVIKNHGSLEVLFPNANIDKISTELYEVTRFVDKNKSYQILKEQHDKTLIDIKILDKKIKAVYPDFKRSYPYELFDKIIKKTDAKYLLKYDRVHIKTMFFGKNNVYSIDTLDEDFPQLDIIIREYIKLKSLQRKLTKISSRINKLERYYKRPTELFARFVEGLFIDTNKISELAPYSYLVFCKELANNRYLGLADFINNFF